MSSLIVSRDTAGGREGISDLIKSMLRLESSTSSCTSMIAGTESGANEVVCG